MATPNVCQKRFNCAAVDTMKTLLAFTINSMKRELSTGAKERIKIEEQEGGILLLRRYPSHGNNARSCRAASLQDRVVTSQMHFK